MSKQVNSTLLAKYAEKVELTDTLPPDDLRPVLLGLFGEVGSVMATAKKLRREKGAYADYLHAVVEEFGDTLWYLAALCRRLKINLDTVFSAAMAQGDYSSVLTADDTPVATGAVTTQPGVVLDLDATLLKLGEAAAALISVASDVRNAKELLCTFANCYLRGLQVANMTVARVVNYNIGKTRGRFLEPDWTTLPTFDDRFEEEERIPSYFEITITQRKSGRSYLQWNGVFIGDPLTDNIRDPDGYRFHDVFHFAHACVLHWSPTFRALIKHKRKSDPKVDEAQDGGRAIVVEEGLTAWIFSRAKGLRFFENKKSISFDMLKTIQEFVSGYEVEECPLKLWEDAVLQGYSVFRQVLTHNGGTIIGDRKKRKVSYQLPRSLHK